ncbi:uncharacterized protein [Nicotiana sylvestris]|uniref:uncharacterized protein n=1 Tax=Nicotiana sylvestris TaxID=4096 RepID=UPI00388CC09E
MDEEDAEKMAFITPWGMYCYKMMPFSLKNTGATYMRAMTTIFHDMIHKEIEDAGTKWTNDYQKAFDKIKEYLSTPPFLVPPKPGRPILLYLVVLDGSFGCVLGQHDETVRKEQAIYYLSKKMNPLKYIFQKPMPAGKLAKWQILLSEFDIVYVTQKAIKGQALADHLAVNPVDGEYKPLKIYFPDEEELLVIGYSDLLIHQVREEWATRNSKILPYLHHIQELRKKFTKTEFQHVPRIQNEFADALATLSSMIQHPDTNFIDFIPVKIHDQPAYCTHVEEEADGKPWFHDIKEM